MHINKINYCAYSEKPVSIKTAIEEAEDGHVGSYLALNDSIIELIKCCPTRLAVNSSDCQILMKVYMPFNFDNIMVPVLFICHICT